MVEPGVIEPSLQVSMATTRAATTRHRHTDGLSGDTYQPKYLPDPQYLPRRRKRAGGVGAESKQQARGLNANCTSTQLEHKARTAPENPRLCNPMRVATAGSH